MDIICLCPANVVTGGTESLHHLVDALNRCSESNNAKILYVGSRPVQPKQYAHYNCPFITEWPEGFTGAVIFPEIWANQVLDPKYSKCTVAVYWQGVDVYNWNVPMAERGLFLKRADVIHFAAMEYGMRYLRSMGLDPIRVTDCVEEEFLKRSPVTSVRGNTVLYNPTRVKMTQFQEEVMRRGEAAKIKFLPLEGYSKGELIHLFHNSKLYIDFGVFSGRERLPREAVACGCCILTSRNGSAGYFRDYPIPDTYKLSGEHEAVRMIKHILYNYENCAPDFYVLRKMLMLERAKYQKQVERLYNALLNHNSRIQRIGTH